MKCRKLELDSYNMEGHNFFTLQNYYTHHHFNGHLSDTPGLTSCLLEFPPPLVLKENHYHHLHFPGEPGSFSNNCCRRQSLRIIGTVSLQASCHQHCQSTEGNQSTNPNKEIHLLASIYLAISNASSPMPVPMELWDVALSRQWTVNVSKATVNVLQSQFINKWENSTVKMRFPNYKLSQGMWRSSRNCARSDLQNSPANRTACILPALWWQYHISNKTHQFPFSALRLLHQKVQKFSSGTGSPWWSRKKGR